MLSGCEGPSRNAGSAAVIECLRSVLAGAGLDLRQGSWARTSLDCRGSERVLRPRRVVRRRCPVWGRHPRGANCRSSFASGIESAKSYFCRSITRWRANACGFQPSGSGRPCGHNRGWSAHRQGSGSCHSSIATGGHADQERNICCICDCREMTRRCTGPCS
jgi:hypothetical protein